MASSKSPSSSTAAATVSTASSALRTLVQSYQSRTPARLKLIDAFLAFLCLGGVLQFAYCVLVSNYPFNAFLAGFASNIGQFVLTAGLRSQVNPENKGEFPAVTPERAFADYAFGSLVLHFCVFSFLG